MDEFTAKQIEFQMRVQAALTQAAARLSDQIVEAHAKVYGAKAQARAQRLAAEALLDHRGA